MRSVAAVLLLPLLAGCSPVVVSETFGDVGDEHEVHGSGAAEPAGSHPAVPEDGDGSIELEPDFATAGGGISIADALEVASGYPVLLDGILLRDEDGANWFCERIVEAMPPECSAPKLFVLNFPAEPDLFDPAVAQTVGATTRDGITWLDGHQLFGIVHPAP